MVEVTLQEYCEEIESLIDQGSLGAAISHCQHIIKAHPKYLHAYSLMGKTALEKGDLEAAADLFSRVLSMDPEDFVARVGMSVACDKDDSLDQAVWHMERAFELAPDNQAIIAELRRLYGRRDGLEPDKIHLTRGALARLHARGNLYTQAVNELQQLLKAEPDRVDLQVALAETLWRADRRIEAAETSLAILGKVPYCLKANLILGEIWSSSGRQEEGAAHLERARMIDPESKTAQALFGERSPLPPVEVLIERMDYVTPPPVEEEEPDWLKTLVSEGVGPVAPDEDIPDWLQAVAASAEVGVASEPDTSPVESEESPDWLQDIAAISEVEAEEFAAVPEAAAPALTESEMPDWLAEIAAEPAVEAVEPLTPEEIAGRLDEAPPPSTEELEVAADELPEWLAEVAPTEAEPSVSEEPELAADELPEWLAELAPTDAELPVSEEPELVTEELPDWLAELAPTDAEPAPTEDIGLAPAEIPDWLAEMAPPEAAASAISELDVIPSEVPEWLAEMGSPEPEPSGTESVEEMEMAPEPSEAAETPDWLSELVEAAGVSMEEEELPTDRRVELEEEEVPEWLLELRDASAPEAEWLPSLTQVEEPMEEELAYAEMAESEVADAEAELMARMDEMSPEEAFAAWEAMLAEGEPEEAAPAPAGPSVTEEPMEEELAYAEMAESEVADAEAELMARMDEMSPEEAFAAWEAMLAEGEPEEAALAPAGPSVTEEPMEEELAYAEMVESEAADAEAELMAPMDEMSPEEAFAAWEAMLAEGEVPEEAAPAPAGPIVIEEPEKERLVYPEGAGGEVTDAEAELLARMDGMSPEEAFAAWEAMLAEGEIPGEEEPSVEAGPAVDERWRAQVDEALSPERMDELDRAWMTLAEDEEPEEVAAAPLPEEAPLVPEAEAAAPPEEEVELPAWALAEALESALDVLPRPEDEIAVGPDWVVLTEEEEARVRGVEELEPVAPPAPPTWVALEEEPVVEASVVDEQVVEPEDDQAQLELARRLWVGGRKEEVYAAYERLIRSKLLDDVIADLEKITADEPLEEPLLRLLGDAYMRDNRLQDALDTYRRALASL